MNKIFYFSFAVFIFGACFTYTDTKTAEFYGFKRSKNFDGINWKNFMAKATWGTNELIKMSTPYVVENYPSGNVSEMCTESLISYVDGIKHWKKWAIRMFDMTGKIPSSFKKGAGIEFGSYDDCVRIDVTSNEASDPFIGQFCMLHLQTTRPILLEEDTPFKKYASLLVPSLESSKRALNMHLGICAPSSCSEQEIYNIVTALTKFTNVTARVSNCETKEPKEWMGPTKYSLLALATLLGVCLIGTRLDVRDNEAADDESTNTSIFRQSLKAFSFRANTLKLFERENVNVEIRRIFGVLFLLCIWIITCNTIFYPTPWKDMRYTTFRDISMAVWFADTFVVAMDAIFFISGFLSIFLLWRISERSGGIFKEFLKIYFRLSAVNAFAILFSFVFPLVYYGPLWHQTWNGELMKCQHNGWFNLLNAQTQLPINDRCWLHTWYPALGMQFFFASIPLIYLVYRYPKAGFTVGILLSAIIVTTENAISTKTLDSLHYFEVIRITVAKFYSKPLFYFLPYLLGILAGRIALRFKDQQLPKVLHAIGWSLSIAICLSVLGDGNFSNLNLDQSSLDHTKRTFYLCIALFWIMYASIVDGVVGRILSSGAIWPLARVSYCAYMMHTLLIILREAALKERIYIAKLTLTIEATSHVVVSFILGMVIHVMVELPSARLWQIYMGHSEENAQKGGIEYSGEISENSGIDEKKNT